MRFWALFCEIRNTEVTIVPEIVIALDAMGGDNAPKAPAEGAREALERFDGLEIELAGPIEQVQAAVDAAFCGPETKNFLRRALAEFQQS